MLSLQVLFILLAATSITEIVLSKKIRERVDDNIEESGDFDFDIKSHKNLKTDQYQQNVDHQVIMKAFLDQQKQKQSSTPTSHLDKPKPKQTSLNVDVNDFIELIPKSEIKAKVEEYYRNDMDTQHIFEFMHSKEFQELRRTILDLADVKDILQYLNRNGMNIKGAVRKVDNRLGISKIRPTSLSYATLQSFGKEQLLR